MGYYKAKMLGAQLVTGDVIVYCDSDCTYESNWLRTILATFSQGDNVQIVAGKQPRVELAPTKQQWR